MKNLSIASLFSLFTIMVSTAIGGEVSTTQKWPTIRPAQLKKFITSENSKVVLDIFSEDSPSGKIYELRCNKGDADDKADGEDDYYGMFQCHLLPTNESGPELFVGEDGWDFNKSYNTRGVFRYEQLVGPCKNNPEFGLHREFNMRGMKVELTISNFSSPPMADMLTGKIQPNYSFDFEANVTVNKSATSKYTSPSAKKYCGGYYKINANCEAVYHKSDN